MEPTDSRIVIDSDASELSDDGISDPFPALSVFSGNEDTEVPPGLSSGDSIPDVGIGEDSGEAVENPRTAASPRSRISRVNRDRKSDESGPRDASSKPPSLDEWQNFFGKVVLKIACDWYLSFAFRGVDEDLLSDREIERLAMTDDERKLIATPVAELSNKSKFMRKHGRAIVASGDAFQAFVVLGAWMSRVNRIAAKYKPRHARVRTNMNGASPNGRSGQSTTEANGTAFADGASGGRVPNGYPVYRPGTG